MAKITVCDRCGYPINPKGSETLVDINLQGRGDSGFEGLQ